MVFNNQGRPEEPQEAQPRTIYVQGGPLRVPETKLHEILNDLRYIMGPVTVRTDTGGSESQLVAEHWARMRSIPVQHGGKPTAIIVPGKPHCLTNTDAPTMSMLDKDANKIWLNAAKPYYSNIIERLYDTVFGTKIVTWLGPLYDIATEVDATQPQTPQNQLAQPPY